MLSFREQCAEVVNPENWITVAIDMTGNGLEGRGRNENTKS